MASLLLVAISLHSCFPHPPPPLIRLAIHINKCHVQIWLFTVSCLCDRITQLLQSFCDCVTYLLACRGEKTGTHGRPFPSATKSCVCLVLSLRQHENRSVQSSIPDVTAILISGPCLGRALARKRMLTHLSKWQSR